MSLKEQARQTQDQAMAIEKSLVDHLNSLVVAMKVDTSKYAFNISSLAFYEKTPIAVVPTEAPVEAPVEAPSEAQ